MQVPTDLEADTFFDSVNGRWNFGGLSKHCPTNQDPKLTRNTSKLLSLISLPRDDGGYLTGHVLQPPRPGNCDCGVNVFLCSFDSKWVE